MANARVQYKGRNYYKPRNTLQGASTVIQETEKFYAKTKSLSLPVAMQKLIHQNNNTAHILMRDARASIQALYDNINKTNEEIKQLNKCKNSLEASLDKVRRNILVNSRCSSAISTRLGKSAATLGIADKQIGKERNTLLKIKQSLEMQLQAVLEHLQKLGRTRNSLHDAIQQRSKTIKSTQQHIVSATSKTAVVEKYIRQSQAIKTADDINHEVSPSISVGKLIEGVNAVCRFSKSLRQQSKSALENTEWIQQATFNAVDTNLRQDLQSASSAKAQVELQRCATRYSRLRQQRAQQAIDRACGIPMTQHTVSGKFQSIVPTTINGQKFQIHGKATELVDMLVTINDNIESLKLSEKQLHRSISERKANAEVDANILRMRQMAKRNHRWVATY
ncbi:uncharacterized protein TRIADDRAFT_53458 [Trichoplax adhaerens]|uniref:Tektin n=1 Tax=Trichoplax adhaerens TaxID=10228 RepID=B3RPA0_TRIAD|nr:hypothetical protein TRIADDRAFT_53458 [Trichoplax adhaerens]EDV28152.1 hypothetical protein TRIADDRAFT_53458 [Trichoplax adhaerens]|eukprot:XP_002109986.1 hypothetical protein TRIADDRAFT_53458 [Trichoplax adhaerens]